MYRKIGKLGLELAKTVDFWICLCYDKEAILQGSGTRTVSVTRSPKKERKARERAKVRFPVKRRMVTAKQTMEKEAEGKETPKVEKEILLQA